MTPENMNEDAQNLDKAPAEDTVEARKRGEFPYTSPKDGSMHFFATEQERIDFIAAQNDRSNQ